MGRMVDRRHRELTDEDIQTISSTYHNWRSPDSVISMPSSVIPASSSVIPASSSVIPAEAGILSPKYEDKKGFCKAAKISEVEKNSFVLTPGRYVGSKVIEENDEVFETKMKRLAAELNQQFEQSKELEQKIQDNLKTVGF